jgi:hypothetical protein
MGLSCFFLGVAQLNRVRTCMRWQEVQSIAKVSNEGPELPMQKSDRIRVAHSSWDQR